MTIFAAIALDQQEQLASAVRSKYEGRFHEVARGHFLINALGTAQDVSNNLGATGGTLGRVVVYNITGYFGYAPTSAWEWLRANFGATSG